ncbi:endonuclease/exonuclease/phosphatase family protein [Marinimicrobium sp. ABcell2]|uniref:endonuclease/exonuclease/phosphatase family protein n=1 Tax=Marinimicrobium sp. ABcell2 TaxID=3069751 RepID=UPI0027B209A9|nr:endonuclease/exonuclease/phosphatase family protein [Marinimicrobium sp. ABcell2]MDQ2077875.1 endonuclease/exonuclease/phosphatase family protein [Marinimicrobium sp. ABcell2]
MIENPLKLRVLTVNTHKGFTYFNRKFVLPELREAVRTVGADVVFLQEVLGAHEVFALRHSKKWPEAPHYEFLADDMWHNYAYGRNAVYPEGHHGNALISKFPIVCHQNVDVSVEFTEKRGLLHCQLDTVDSDITLHAICVHLGLRGGHRKHQLALLCNLIEALPKNEPVIVAGDFNDWLGKAQSVMAECGLTDVFSAVYGAPPKTFPALFPLLRLDRIYVRGVKDFSPVRLPNRPWSHLSDHAPLAAEIIL